MFSFRLAWNLQFLPLVVAAAAACGESKQEACSAGEESCECYPNGTCNGELACLSDLCVDSSDAADDSDSSNDGKTDMGQTDADAGDVDANGTSDDETEPDQTDASNSTSDDDTQSDQTESSDSDTTSDDTSSQDPDPGPAPAGSPVAQFGKLRVVGTHLVSENDEVVQLKGVSSMWLNWEHDGYAEDKEGLRYMRDNWNLSLIRVAMGVDEEDAYLEDPDKAIGQVETIVNNALELGVYVLIDWHDHNALSHQSEAQAFFAAMAAKYGSTPNVLYEVFNEPLDVDWTTELKPYHEALRDTIRAEDPDNVIILGTPNWDQDVDVAAASPLSGSNLMYSLHFYSCTHGSTYRSKAQQALNAGLPMFVTEWGAATADGIDACGTVEAAAWHDWMDEHAISWAAWKFDNCTDATCFFVDDNVPTDGNWTDEQLNGVHPQFAIERMQRVPQSTPDPVDPDPNVTSCSPTGSCSTGDGMDCDTDGELVARDCTACDILGDYASYCGSVGHFGAVSQPSFTIEPDLVDSFMVGEDGATLAMSFDFASYGGDEQIGAMTFALDDTYSIYPEDLVVCLETNGDIQVSLEDGDSGCLYNAYLIDGCALLDYFYPICWGDWASEPVGVRQVNVRVAGYSSAERWMTVTSIDW